jgi:uncharacterized protein (TIGR03437 family)
MKHFLQTIKTARNAMIVIGSAVSLYGQTNLTSGGPVPFYLTSSDAILNGRNGYVIPIPGDPIELTVNVQIANPTNTAVNGYLRCGTDVGGANVGVAVFDTQGRTDNNGKANVFLFLGVAGGGLEEIGSFTAMVTPDNPNAPKINDSGIVTNAGFTPGPVAPGSMVAIFGTNFGPVSYPSTLPLPTTLGGIQVFFNAVPAPLFYVSPTQIVAQVPLEASFAIIGPSTALVTVISNGVPSIAQTVTIAPFAAGIFTTPTGDSVVIDNNTGLLVTPSAPASRGDTLIIWATGLGPTLLDPSTGNGAPATGSEAPTPTFVILKSSASGAQITPVVQYEGLAPGFVGLNQINVQIPADAPTGTVILQLYSPGFPLPNPYTIGIQ